MYPSTKIRSYGRKWRILKIRRHVNMVMLVCYTTREHGDVTQPEIVEKMILSGRN
jgi:hypothetical protein